MTRLNSTFRSGCKLGNRTIREGKQPGQAHKLRRNSRVVSKKSRVFIEIDKTFARTYRLFRKTLHERPTRTTRATSEKAIRVMDVARQSSMEDGLQVQLLPWKENPNSPSSDNLKEHRGYSDKIVFSRVCDNRQDSSRMETDEKVAACSLQDEVTSGQLNGVEKIEACVRSENRMQHSMESVEKSLKDIPFIPHPDCREANKIITNNGIACDCRHLRRSLNSDIQCCHRARDEPGELDTADSANGRAKGTHISLKDTQVRSGNKLSQLTSGDTLDRCIANLRQKVRVLEQNIDEKVAVSDQCVKSGKLEKRDDGIFHLSETDILDDGSRIVFESNATDIVSTNGSQFATNVDKSNNDSMTKELPCDSIDNVTSFKSVSAMVGRPKRASRQLRPRHEDDYILDVRQIPHKFNDKISTVKKGNKKALLPGCRKRRRIKKHELCDNLQGNGNVNEKLCTEAEDTGEEKYTNVDCVLGVRHDDSNKQQVLVQFTDGTSNWIKKSEMKSPPMSSLCAYLSHPEQDLLIAHRLPSQWFGLQLTPWEDRPLEVTDFEFFTKDNKASKDYKTSSSYFHDKQRNRPSQDLSSAVAVPLELSENCKYLLEESDTVVSPDGRRINSPELCSLESIEEPHVNGYASIPLALNSLTDDGLCTLKDFDDMVVDNDTGERRVIEGGFKKASPLLLEGSPYRKCTSVSSDAVPIFVSRNGEIEVLQSDHIEIILKHKDKRSKRIRSETCDNLIHQLESRINDDECQFVVISGLEDYFASSMDMEKLIKFPSEAEKTKYDEKMANLRYLFQTLKNYPKPVVAVISSAATGLAASLLSLVDVVYDQSRDKIKKNGMYGKPHLPVLAPKLMGLQHRNEALLMGESPHAHIDEQLKQVNHIFKSFKFSEGITSTLKEMRVNEKLSLVKPNPKKRGRENLAKNSQTFGTVSHQSSYNKTRLARLRCPTSFEEEEADQDVDKALKMEIEKEQELASQCLKELNEFWKEIAESACKL